MTGKSMPHATHGHRGHVLTSAAKITKESAVNHKEIDTNGVNRMLLRRPWQTDQKNRFLDKVWTPQFSTTPPKPFLLSFSTHLVDQTLARSIWKRKSQFSNWPKDYNRLHRLRNGIWAHWEEKASLWWSLFRLNLWNFEKSEGSIISTVITSRLWLWQIFSSWYGPRCARLTYLFRLRLGKYVDSANRVHLGPYGTRKISADVHSRSGIFVHIFGLGWTCIQEKA